MEATFQPQSVPATSSSGRTLKTIWRVLVAIQGTVAVFGVIIGLVISRESAGSSGTWSDLGEIIGIVLIIVSAIALAWFAMMMFASFQSNVVAATMGIIQGLLYLAPTVLALDANRGAGFISALTTLAIGIGWISLCATYRKWPTV